MKDELFLQENGNRLIASWLKVGGRLKTRKDVELFGKWLKSSGLNEEETTHMTNLVRNGKLEFQESARKFLEEREQTIKD